MVEHHGPIAEAADLIRSVRDQADRTTVGLEAPDPFDALALEGLVANGQHFVDQQHIGFEVDGDGKSEPGVHA